MEQPSPTSSLVSFEQIYVKPRPGRTLIVGSRIYGGKEDRRKRYADALGMDMLEGEGVDVVQDLTQPVDIGDVYGFDHIECMSVLEHCAKPWLMAANIERLLKPGGTLFVSVPFVWRLHAYPDDFWRLSPAALPVLFPEIEWRQTGFAHETVVLGGGKIPSTKSRRGHPYMSRTETAGFGVRR